MDYEIKTQNSIKSIPLPRRKFSGRDVKEKMIKHHTRRRRKKNIVLFLLGKIIFFLFTIGLLSIFLGLGMIKGILDSTPPLTSFHFGPTAFVTKIEDRKGNVIDQLVKAGANRESVKYADIPENLVNAFVAIEDERFWEHSGVDFKSIMRAVYGVLNQDSSMGGGSTITQQLVKNAVFDSALNEKGFEKYVRKLQEQYIALQYESQEDMSKKEIKEQIITDYLNVINLGANTLGVKVAARRYFDKDLKDLTISECAVIASITKNPTKNNPITHPDNNKKRQNQVLKNMYDFNYITKEEYDEAVNDDVYSRIKNVDIKVEGVNDVYCYFTEAVIDQLQEDLVKRLGYTDALARNLLYSGGLRIETTMDPDIQKIVDAEVSNEKNYKVKKYSIDYRLSIRHKDDTLTHYSQIDVHNYHQNVKKNKKYDGLYDTKDLANQYINSFRDSVLKEGDTVAGETCNYFLEPQCSFVMINHNSGEVVALSGGRGEKTVSRSLNRATNTKRQPGSTFKVLTAFAPALELYNKTLGTTYYDSEYTYKEKTFKNWYNTGYLGFQNIRAGIVYSLNIIAVRCLMETVTPEVGVRFAKKFGITSLDDVEDANPAAALGGLTYGVSNMELTSAFAAIANEGTYVKPVLYTKVYDHDGKVILDNTRKQTQRVLSRENAYLLTSAMADSMVGGKAYSSPAMNVTPTSTRAWFKKMSLAGKSGTTTKNNDIWFVGFTPYYTAGVWGGCDENQPLSNTSFHKDIWRKIMQTVHTGLADPGFDKPASIVTRTICRKSGLLASEGCKHDLRGDATYDEYFIDGTQPKKRCNVHTADGFINMPSKYRDQISEDTLLIKNDEVVPIVPEMPDVNIEENGPVVSDFSSTYNTPPTYDGDINTKNTKITVPSAVTYDSAKNNMPIDAGGKNRKRPDTDHADGPLERYFKKELSQSKSLKNYFENNYIYANGQQSISYYDGILTHVIKDFDGDGEDELAIFKIKTDTVDELSGKEIILEMIKNINGEAIKVDEISILNEQFIGENLECYITMKYVGDTPRIYVNYYEEKVREETYENKLRAIEYVDTFNTIADISFSGFSYEAEFDFEKQNELMDAGVNVRDDSDLFRRCFVNDDASMIPIFTIRRVNEKMRDGYIEDFFADLGPEDIDGEFRKAKYGYTQFLDRVNG